MNIRPLLNRRPLEAGESLPSLLARLQNANHYRNPKAIADICRLHLPPGENLHLPRFAETWPVLEAITRLPAEDLYEASFHYYASVLALPWETLQSVSLPTGRRVSLISSRMQRPFLRPLQDAQYCPACLASRPYHRRCWSSLLVAICPGHECLLQQGCPHCSKKLAVSAIVAGRCSSCECDLATTRTVSVSDDMWGMWAQAYLQSLLGHATIPPWSDPIGLPERPASILLEVLAGIATAATRLPEEVLHKAPVSSSSHLPSTPHKVPTPTQVYCAYATALQAMTEWPQSFYRFLDTYRQRSGIVAGQVAAEFAPLYGSWLEERWRRPAFAFVQEAFDDFLVANYPLSRSVTRLDRYRRNRDLRDRFPYLTQMEAAERLQVEPEIVQRLIDAELLVDFEHAEGHQRHWHQRLRIVRRAEFLDLQLRWQAGILSGDVARVLDVDEQLVEVLVRHKLLVKSRPVEDVSDGILRIEAASLSNLVSILTRYPVLPANFGVPAALQELVGNSYELVQVLKQVVANEVMAYWPGGSLYSLWVSQNDLHLLRT